MICYRDTTFCISECATECNAKLTDEVRRDAVRWWGNDDAPIMVNDFKCSKFTEKGEPNEASRPNT
jgi:hypothetical protein